MLTSFDLALWTWSLSHRMLPEQPGPRGYMAPELFRGTVTKQSDLFALGCIAYELCTGRLPFSESELVSTVSQEPKPPLAPHLVNPDVTPQMEHAIFKAISIKQHLRYDDVEAFIAGFTKM